MSLSREEKEIRRKLQAHEAGLDTDALWAGVEAELRPRRKKRLIFIWIFLFGLLAGSGLGWWLWQPEGAGIVQDNILTESFAETPEDVNRNLRGDVLKSESFPDLEAAIASGEGISSSGMLPPEQKEEAQPASMLPGKQIVSFSLLANEEADESSLPAESELKKGEELEEKNTPSPAENWTTTAFLPRLEPLLEAYGPDDLQVSSASPPFLRRKAPWGAELELRFGAGAFSSRTTAATPEYEQTARQWNQLERPLEALNLQLGLRLRHRSGAYLSTGLSASRLTERWSQQDSRVEWDTLSGQVNGIYLPAGGDTILQQGDLPLKRTIRSNTRWHTYHYLLDVPVFLGYEWRLKRLRFGAEAGLLFNLAKFTDGAYLLDDGQLAFFESSEPHPYRSRLGLGYHLGLQLQAELPVLGQVYLHPWWQARPGNWLQEGQPLRKTYQQFGLNVGLRWRL